MKKILIVVDMQKDFISGSLGTQKAQTIVSSVIKKIQSYPRENIYFTLDTHQEDYLSTQEGRKLPIVHCIENSDGWQLDESIQPYALPDQCIKKPTFGSLELAKRIQQEYEKEEITIEIVGLCTDICVVSNALLLKATMPEVPIICDSSCCAGVSKERHEAALETMRSCQIEVC